MKISFRGFAAAATLALVGGMAQAAPLPYQLDNVVYSSPFGGAGVIGIDFMGVCPSCLGGGGTLSTALVDGSNVSLADVSFGLASGASNFLLTIESAQTIVGMGVALIKSGVTCDAVAGSACLETSTRSALLFPVDFTGQAADGTLCEACEVNVILSNDLQNLTVEIRKQLTQGFAGQQFYALNYTLIPVPAAVWLFASALGLVGWLGRRRARAA
ncbi:MAG: hypothetical protein JJT85_04795 [Chromatiales bacterium]|nr:hypothetical protein [Chromatiales bacterium]